MADILQNRNRKPVGGGAPAAGPAGGPAAAPAAGSPAGAPQQRGSGFVSFDRILAANQAGAQAMAQRVGDKVQAAGQGAVDAVHGGTDAFAANAQKAGLGFDPSQAPTAAQATALSQAPTYTGPRAWTDANSGVDTAAISKKVNEGNAAVAQLQTQGGLVNLLREGYNGPPATAGGNALDAALTGAAGGARFQALQKQFGGLDKLLSDAAGGAGDVVKGVEDKSADAAARYGALVPGLAAQERDAAQRAEWERQRQARADAAQSEPPTGQWTTQDAQNLEDIRSRGSARNRRPIGGR